MKSLLAFLSIGLLALIVAESFIWYWNKVPFPMTADPRRNLYASAIAETVRLLDPDSRIHVENAWGTDYFGLPSVPEKFGSLFDIPATTDWEPLALRAYQDYCSQLTGQAWYYGHFQIAGRPFDEKMFDMLAARYIVFSDAGEDWIAERIRDAADRNRYRLVKDLVAQRIYENTEALPRVNFASRWEVKADSHELFQRMHEPSFDPATTALLLREDTAIPSCESSSPQTQPAKAVITHKIGHEVVEILADTPTDGVVWIADCSYPGWRIFVDGSERELLRVNYVFRGVFVERGRHKIRMEFKPASFRHGLLLGAMGLMLALGLVFWPGKSQQESP